MFFKHRLLSLGKEEFIAAVTANIPPHPANMERLVAINLRHVVLAE